MPMCKWTIEPTDLTAVLRISEDGVNEDPNHNNCNKLKPPDNYCHLANIICSNIIRQLVSLADSADGIFKELAEQSCLVSKRFEKLNFRVAELSEKAKNLNPTVELISLDDVMQCKPFKSGLKQYASGSGGRPEAVQTVFDRIEPIPDFDKWNCYKTEEKDPKKFYSDPNFFFESWCGQIKQEVDKLKPARKKKVAKKKEEITRKPQNVNLNKIQNRVKNEILGGRPLTVNQNSDNQSQRSINVSINSEANQVTEHDRASLNSKTSEANQNPASDSIQVARNASVKGVKNTDDVIGPQGIEFPVFYGEDVNDFPQPPIPPPPLPQTFSHAVEAGQLRNKNATAATSTTTTNIKSQPSLEGKRESRGDLLASIRNGIKLRKVDEVKREVASNKNAGQTMFDVQMIMEMRRRALEEEEEEYDEDDGDDDNDWG
ncbi:hypothetical protein HELRODRAFT_181744 [Helobdella robusta]|uniref:Wiskott-Aldrich syndrome protein family member n=1 Tax=Helobdella robusta TaxID=6412 RepID=T1FH99_HELRO|nr:hypothetical protein HELRODRAFT_181744 [Helobdella robusta]ESN92125.1 hypothetical protein HELRODRAFT_181744 [Helobdella robusta]